jgi:hypothetical protein
MRKVIALSVGMILVVVFSGCQGVVIKESTILEGLTLAGSKGSEYGLKEWAKTQPIQAKECATALQKNISGQLIPYLNGANLPPSVEVQAFISSSLFKDVAANIKNAITLASVALDALLPIPSAQSYLTSEQTNYIRAFLIGVNEGCSKFLGIPVTRTVTTGTWLE